MPSAADRVAHAGTVVATELCARLNCSLMRKSRFWPIAENGSPGDFEVALPPHQESRPPWFRAGNKTFPENVPSSSAPGRASALNRPEAAAGVRPDPSL